MVRSGAGPTRVEAVRALAAGVRRELERPVSARPLVLFRIAFGLLMVWEVTRYFRYGWIDRYFVQPDFLFKYYGFGWVTPWPGPGMHIHFAALGLLAAAVAAGAWFRLSCASFCLGFTYVFLLDQTTYLNHFYLIALVSALMACVPANAGWSVDAWRRPSLRSATVPAWTLWLLRFQIAVPYFYGGLAKIDGDWLRGEPMRMWLAARRDVALLGPYVDLPWMAYAFSYGGLVVDILAVPLLLYRRTTFFALGALAVFHLLNAMLFSIGVFPWLMLAVTTILFWPRRSGTDVAGGMPTRRLTRVQLALLATWVAVQALIPLRHLLYPGDADWTEEGHRFAWHMKLRDKESRARFRVTDVASGETWEVDPAHYLTRRQVGKMSGRPDMIQQFAAHLADSLARQGMARVEVRAHVLTSLNGRPAQLLVDPEADLAHQPRTLRPAGWILPLTIPLPRPGELQGERVTPAEDDDP